MSDLYQFLAPHLPYIFAFLMGLSMLIYAILDGYDLGIGMLIPLANSQEKDRLIAAIGPFWDANETWLVLGVGLLLVAFPMAHGIILTQLYLPTALMLIGLIFRGVAFDFRAKVPIQRKKYWNLSFFLGSLTSSAAQGYMLGMFIMGFSPTLESHLFSLAVSGAVIMGYILIGACWAILKCEGSLQQKAVKWAQAALIGTAGGILLVSIATPSVNERIFDKWFTLSNLLTLLPIPVLTAMLVFWLFLLLRRLPHPQDAYCLTPFLITIGIFTLCFIGLAYSFYPYIVPDQLLITEAASAPESLWIIFLGAIFVLPILLGYTAIAYWIFHGKAQDLSYD